MSSIKVATVDGLRYKASLTPGVRLPNNDAPSDVTGFGSLKKVVKPCVVLHWLVRTSGDYREANVIYKTIALGVDKMRVQVIAYKKMIKNGAEIIVFQEPPPPKTPAPTGKAKRSKPGGPPPKKSKAPEPAPNGSPAQNANIQK